MFGIAAIVAGLAGVMYGPILAPNYHMGMDFLVLSFVVVVVGGMGSLPGAVAAGFLLGILAELCLDEPDQSVRARDRPDHHLSCRDRRAVDPSPRADGPQRRDGGIGHAWTYKKRRTLFIVVVLLTLWRPSS